MTTIGKFLLLGLVASCSLSTATTSASAQQLTTGAVSKSRDQIDVTRFCSNVIDEARERRYALKEKKLKDLMKDVEQRISVLDEKRALFQEWMRRREKFADEATESIVDIYSNMRPDAAAKRMEILEAPLAAAILLKLPPRDAGVILNEMNPKAAAAVTSIIADSARKTDPS